MRRRKTTRATDSTSLLAQLPAVSLRAARANARSTASKNAQGFPEVRDPCLRSGTLHHAFQRQRPGCARKAGRRASATVAEPAS